MPLHFIHSPFLEHTFLYKYMLNKITTTATSSLSDFCYAAVPNNYFSICDCLKQSIISTYLRFLNSKLCDWWKMNMKIR